MKAFFPDIIAKDVYAIDYAFLQKYNIKGVIFDIDNTLVPFKTQRPDERLTAYMEGLKENGIKIAVLSNNKKARVDIFNETLLLYAIARAGKPGKKSYERVLCQFGCEPHEVLVVGDQLFTDVYGGKRSGMMTALVKPINTDTDWFILFKRAVEKVLFQFGKNKGYIAVSDYNMFYGTKGE